MNHHRNSIRLACSDCMRHTVVEMRNLRAKKPTRLKALRTTFPSYLTRLRSIPEPYERWSGFDFNGVRRAAHEGVSDGMK